MTRTTGKMASERHDFIQLLNVCTEKQDLHGGMQLHVDIVNKGLLVEENGAIPLTNKLIHMYARCGEMSKAQKIHDDMFVRNVISWNALISGYVQQGKSHTAFDCLLLMQCEGLSPDAFTFSCILKACGCVEDVEKGEEVHHKIVRRGLLQGNIVLGTALVDMYAKCGNLSKAQQLHVNLCAQDVVSWNALIAGHVKHGHGHEALNCFEKLKCEGIFPDAFTFTCILKACGSTRVVNKGETVHIEIISSGLMKENIVLGSALVDMYSKCGAHAKAQQVHDELPFRNNACWNSLIAGYAQDQKNCEAMNCFKKMKDEGVSPDAITFACMLKVCGNMGAINKGKQIHDEIVCRNMLKNHISLGNALVDMYAKCGMLTRAQQVHNKFNIRNIISWNALIAGYVRQGQGHEALNCFERMKGEGSTPDEITFTCILNACGTVKAIERGKQIHEEVVKRGFLGKDPVLGITLVDMYAKCGLLGKAQKVHDELCTRNIVSWSALIAGYAQHGQCHEALTCLKQMQTDGISPNTIVFTSILKSCGSAGAIDKGKQIHDIIVNKGWLEKDLALGNALVDMYAKCGALSNAQQLMDELQIRDVVSWNTVIGGYAERGYGREALNCFEHMESEGLSPDGVTFLCLLNACSHSGLLSEAEMYFDKMIKKYSMTPNLEHCTCMVIIFGCVGKFEKAMLVIKQKMPSLDYPAIWLALLSCCRKWGYVNLARLAFDWVVQLDNNCASAYVLMSNIYAAANMPEDVKKVESMRAKNRI